MPYTATDHQDTRTIEMSNFMGGMNSSVPPTQIGDNECTLIQNMYLDRVSGKLRSRFPIRKYSATATAKGLNGLYYWKKNWILVSTDRFVYYLDSSKVPVLIGQLNGAYRPCFCPFGDKLVISSGGILQQIAVSGTTPQSLTDIAACTSRVKYVMQKYSRLLVGGDEEYPDRIIESAYEDPGTWSYGATDYADIGYKDDTEICGIAEAFEGLYLIFKRGSGGLRTYYITTLSSIAPQCTLAADSHAPVSHAGIIQVLTRVYLMERNHIAALVGTDAQGKIIYDQTPGLKISQSFKTTEDGFATLYPRDAQIWFVPDPNQGQVYVYHYHIGTWSTFSFTSRKIRCAFYDAPSDYLYVGCDDGFVYKYDYDSMLYADTAGAYTSRFITKMYAQGNREMVLKAPRLVWTTLAAGSGTMKVNTDYGQTSTTWGTITTSAPQEYVYDTAKGLKQDFTTFTEVDVGANRAAVAANTVTVSDCDGDEIVYVYKDFTSGYFDGNFEFEFTLNVAATSTETGTQGYAWALGNTVNTVNNVANALSLQISAGAPGLTSLNIYETLTGLSTNANTDLNITHGTTYTIRIVRDESIGTYGRLTVYQYNTSTGELVESAYLTLRAKTDFRYLYAFSSATLGLYTDKELDVTISNMWVDEGNTFNPVYVYDTQAGYASETYVFPETVYEEQKGDYNQPTESFQFDVALTSGGFMVERLVAEVASSRRV